MRTSKFDLNQIAIALHESKSGIPTKEICRKMGVSESTFHNWKRKYGKIPPPEIITPVQSNHTEPENQTDNPIYHHKENILWGIHSGKEGNTDDLFINKGFIGVGWARTGNLKKLQANRETFKQRFIEAYPDEKPGSIPIIAGQLFRFCIEMKTGDLVVYPRRKTREVYLGEITGEYMYRPRTDNRFPNLRRVKWLKSVPRTMFSQGALYEIGSDMTLFQVKNFTEEFIAVVRVADSNMQFLINDTAAMKAEDAEQLTHDYVLRKLAIELKGHRLADFVAHLLSTVGYRTRISAPGADYGVDILAHKDELGLEPPLIKVQVKSSDTAITDQMVSALYGKVEKGEYALFIALSTFTSPAKSFAKSKSNLRLIDGNELVDMILLHYEELDPKYQSLIPLKRVYIPDE